MAAASQTDRPLNGSFLGNAPNGDGLNAESLEAIRHLREQVANGKEWGLAMLEAAGMWTQAVEEREGRIYVYLVGAEAFD